VLAAAAPFAKRSKPRLAIFSQKFGKSDKTARTHYSACGSTVDAFRAGGHGPARVGNNECCRPPRGGAGPSSLVLGQWERVEVLPNQALGSDRFLFKREIRDWMAPMERFIF
jgi:hypothetical protein